MPVKIMNEKETWDSFIDDSSYGSLFHKWDFLKIIEKYSGFELIPYGFYKGNELICLFPMFYKVKNGIKMLLSPPPQVLVYIPHLGFVMHSSFKTFKQKKKESYLNSVVSEFNEEISKISPNLISIYTVPGLYDLRQFIWTGYDLRTQYSYTIDLNNSLDDIFDNFEKPLKKKLKPMISNNSDLTLKQVNDVDTFVNIMRERLAPYGTNFFSTQSPDYIKDILSAFPDNVRLAFLYDKDEIVAMNVICKYKGRVTSWMGSPHIKDGNYNDYLLWQTIKEAKEEGCTIYENWGADTQRLCLFKSKFNPSLELSFNINKRDTRGLLAGWAYDNVLNRPQIRSLLLRH
ncbi:GNAT family N-acetyltransferase [Methanocella sp. CWC-04]|uniref:GNAT family N-acetyltransferase n=1 Tax=Methanooceanicella nereidis TaxID=2052831 RepID=A0AAP2RCM8_9EURY|nr:GNAT family N-acetyltransferase [Methanocella sp. CWC-04]MCD1294878.1 GNAT family N-acetyltransferase [Methanocella sp. CWC-04]